MKTLASLLLIAYLSAAAADSAEISYEVHFTEEEMTLDGRADEKSWGLAPSIELTDRTYPSLKPISSASTRVKALWNEQGLLVLYQCQDQNILATITKRDSSVYKDDDVELFLDPDMDGTHYLQLAINALNTQMDVLQTETDGKPSFPNWNSGAESAVVVAGSLEDGADQDESWTVELFFPWSGMGQESLELNRRIIRSCSLAKAVTRGEEVLLDAEDYNYHNVNERDVLGGQSVPPKVGDRWKANFNRFDHGWGEGKDKDTDHGSGKIFYREGDIASGWGFSPTSGSFHEPAHWGVLVFVK